MNDITRGSARRTPWALFNELDSMLDEFRSPGGQEWSGSFAPAVDVTETGNEYHVRADLPGVKKEDLDISIQDGVLTINAETRREETQEEQGRVIRQERRYGQFVRSMQLGDVVDVDNIKADYKDGVLDLVLPKAEQIRPRKIDVKVS